MAKPFPSDKNIYVLNSMLLPPKRTLTCSQIISNNKELFTHVFFCMQLLTSISNIALLKF